MSTGVKSNSAKREHEPIASVSLEIRLMLGAILFAGVLAVIVPAVANMHGERQELIHELCHGDASLTHRGVCSR